MDRRRVKRPGHEQGYPEQELELTMYSRGTGCLKSAGRWMLMATAAATLAAQQPPTGQAQTPAAQTPAAQTPAATPETPLRHNYVLGSNDQITIRAADAEELNAQPYRVDEAGDVTLPLVGKIRAAGLTVSELQAALVVELRKYIQNPQAEITVVQFRSDPVFVVGAFLKPGIYPLQGRRKLLDLMTTVGGLQTTASRRVRVTRRLEFGKIPLAEALEDPRARVSTVEINLNRLMETVNPAEDIEIEPYDVITAQPAGKIMVSGEVTAPGAFDLNERDFLPVVQVLSLAGGLTPNAAPDKARILRPVLDTTRRAEIPVDLRLILQGQANDVPLMANDLLVVPRNRSTAALIGRYSLVVIPLLSIFLVALIRR